jgi:hypothetical protein
MDKKTLICFILTAMSIISLVIQNVSIKKTIKENREAINYSVQLTNK